MSLQLFVDGCVMFSLSKDKIDKLYASLKEDFKI